MHDFHSKIKKCAEKRILYTTHAINRMNMESRLISIDEVEYKIYNGRIIEEYPHDKRGHSCLLNSEVNSRPIHVVCAPKDDYLAIITAYLPNKDKWEENFSKRRE